MENSRQTFPILSSLRRRLLFLICLATLPAILFVFLMALREKNAIFERIESDAFHVARLTSREHRHQIQGARKLLRWLGAKLAQEGNKSSILADPDFLPSLLAGYPQLANIGVLSPEGRVLVSAYPVSDAADLRDNPAFVAALHSKDVSTGQYLISPIFKRPTLNHAFAVRDPQQQVQYVVFNGLDLEWLSEMSRQIDLSEPFSLAITDKEGRTLMYAGPEHSEIAERGALVIPDIAELAQQGRGKLITIHDTEIRRYFVAAPLEQAPDLYVAVGLSYEKVLRQTNSVFYRSLVVLGLLTSFTIVAVYVATEVVVLRVLRLLMRAVRDFGAGDLSARAAVPRGYNELAALAQVFNDMADSLSARHREAAEAQAQLRALSGRLQQAREAEAARIARELHDEVGQALTSLRIDLSRLPLRCGADGATRSCAQELRNDVAAMNQRILATVDFVRQISTELRPSVLDRLGLPAALDWLAREIESRTDLAVRVEVPHGDLQLEEHIATTLFRIAQEALTNVVRHANASQASIFLTASDDEIVLEICDDGKGIMEGCREDPQSLGILGMRERAALINGRLMISDAVDGGARLTVTVPLPPSPSLPL